MENKIINKCDKDLSRIEINAFEIDNPLIFEYFNGLKKEEKDSKFLHALYLGTIALMEENISAFMFNTKDELGRNLEYLKRIYDMKYETFFKTSVKGLNAEPIINEQLKKFLEERKINDKLTLTGVTAGKLPKNKTGDIICEIEANPDIKIAIECKLNKSFSLGEMSTKDFTKKTDTVWSQLLESTVNRDAKISIIVMDKSLIDSSILNFTSSWGYIANVGLVVIIDMLKNNYENLFAAYMLAREIALNAKQKEYEAKMLSLLVNGVIKAMNESLSIEKLVKDNIKSNYEILKKLKNSNLYIDFLSQYLNKYLTDGVLSQEDLWNYYSSNSICEKFKEIETKVKEDCSEKKLLQDNPN